MVLNTDASWAARTARAVLLVRILVGWVFLSEGPRAPPPVWMLFCFRIRSEWDASSRSEFLRRTSWLPSWVSWKLYAAA